ncbi:AAA family ATPase [Streptosporangium sp. OZ121]|uniref:AAA family ATPase n=1 Tax=Streptosporangium sp. OZ121 TaxID=3444183 RepID=UPI003F7999D5
MHVSVRIPWHDSGWSGTVCRNPLDNASCILLHNIGTKRDDQYEIEHAGKSLDELDTHRIACVGERGTFLSSRPYPVVLKHPYRHNRALRNLQPTTITVPAFGVQAIPYYWLLRESIAEVSREYDLVDFDDEREALVDRELGFTPSWVIHGDNQKTLIGRFFDDVKPNESLVFFYAKHSPFDDLKTEGHLLVGAARITDLQLPQSWRTDGPTPFPNHMWETAVSHTLRPGGAGGILLPVTELAERHARGEDVRDLLAWAPENGGREFRYATEHVSHDSAIDALDRLFRAAERCRKAGLDVPHASMEWVSERIGELWTARGPAPGLGAVLGALKFRYSKVLAREITRLTPKDTDPWEVLNDVISHPQRYAQAVSGLVTDTHRKVWLRFTAEELRVLWLLSRFQLTSDQATILFQNKEIDLEHGDLLADPYLAHICTVGTATPVPFGTVDRACFPKADIRERFPMAEPTAVVDPDDPRRLQALLVDTLEAAAQAGDTVMPMSAAIQRIAEKPLAETCEITEQKLNAHDFHPDDLTFSIESPYWPPVAGTRLADGSPAYKLARLELVAHVIRGVVDGQIARPRHPVPEDLADELDRVLAEYKSEDDPDPEAEERAGLEKRAALAELFAAPLSVLNGRAGTGKTTLIRALAAHEKVRSRNMLLLAPTGKARVQLQTKVRHSAQTIAQFLTKHERYRDDTRSYVLAPDRPKAQPYGTVVVDEASMLTEEQLAALLDALPMPDRLILVGDPRQLPPIGAGRPFADLIHRLAPPPGSAESVGFPRVAPGYAELTELRRQQGKVRDDLMLAAWFSGDPVPPGFDEVWERLRTGTPMETLAAVSWAGSRALDVLDSTLAEEQKIVDSKSFETSYGGELSEPWVNFRKGAAASCEKWQILTPTRVHGWGTIEINRHLKRTFRGKALADALRPLWERSVPKPLGAEQIVLGDKVLNNANGRRKPYPANTGLGYVANGEIGVVVGQVGRRGSNPRWTQVEFSSQEGTTYGYSGMSEDDPPLELAWAITIHKSQGSEFRKVIVVLPGSARKLSREMIYTALTRQQDKVTLLHECSIDDLRELTVSTSSETARRLTDLFTAPAPRELFFPDGASAGVLDAKRVHITAQGVIVRSHSEVIIADLLDRIAPGRWGYDQPLTLNGETKRPDFTIIGSDGRAIHWEHLEMFGKRVDHAWWEERKRWYGQGGVLLPEEGDGTNGILLRTDDKDGVNEPAWAELARQAIGTIPSGPVIPTPAKVRRTPPGQRG